MIVSSNSQYLAMMRDRDGVPASVKRLIRQRCGFGCVICGCPIYDYEHIYGIAETGNDPEAMTLLCNAHHREKTNRRLPVRMVEQHNAAPFNGAAALSTRHPLYFDQTRPLRLRLGNFEITPTDSHDMVGVAVDGLFVFGVRINDDSGTPSIEVDVRDLDNRMRLRVANGQMRFATSSWDVEYVGTRITVRSAPRQIALQVRFLAEDSIVEIERADIAAQHVRMHIGSATSTGGFELPDDANSISHLTFDGGSVSLGSKVDGPVVLDRRHPRRAYGAPPAPSRGSFESREAVSLHG